MSVEHTNKSKKVFRNVSHVAKIFEEHGDFIRSVIRFNVKNEVLSDDLFQELFLFFVAKPMPKEIQNVRGFLYRVISDRSKDALRRIDRYHGRICRYSEHRLRLVERRPDNGIIEIEEMEKMLELIERHLPSRESMAVTLRYRDNNSVTEAARKMNVRTRSVSRYVSVGLKKLRQVLSVD